MKYIHAMVQLQDLQYSSDDLLDKFRSKLTQNQHFTFNTSDVKLLRQDCFILMKNIKTRYDHLPPNLKRLSNNDSDGETSANNVMDIDLIGDEESTQESDVYCQPCSDSESEIEEQKDTMSLRPGFQIHYKLPQNQGKPGSALINEILPEGTVEDCRVILSNGVKLKPGVHEVKIFKFRVQSTGKMCHNEKAVWQKLQDYHLITGEYCDGQLHCPELRVKQKQKDKNDREVSSRGLTTHERNSKRRHIRKRHLNLDRKITLPDFFARLSPTSKAYKKQIKELNHYYKRLINAGKANDRMPVLLEATSTKEFEKAKKTIQGNLDYYKKQKYVTLEMPNERKVDYAKVDGVDVNFTNRTRDLEEDMLAMELKMKRLSIKVCPSCKENVMVSNDSEKAKAQQFTEILKRRKVCTRCTKLDQKDHYLEYNLHPIWYEHDMDGNMIEGPDGKPIVHYDIPSELTELTVPEKMLIRRYAPYIPTFHVKKGHFATRGNCVTFPQDISEACDILPRMKSTMVTFIRELRSNVSTQTSTKQYKVNKNKILKALQWLKRHHEGYKDITIKMDNLWFDEEEIDILQDSTTFHINDQQREDIERVSEAHDKDLGNVDEEEFEMSTMHANEYMTIPRGDPTQPIKDLIQTTKDANQMDKVLDFPAISTEPVS